MFAVSKIFSDSRDLKVHRSGGRNLSDIGNVKNVFLTHVILMAISGHIQEKPYNAICYCICIYAGREWTAILDVVTDKIVGRKFCRRTSQFSAAAISNSKTNSVMLEHQNWLSIMSWLSTESTVSKSRTDNLPAYSTDSKSKVGG
jgi:hypothetical protein